MAFDVFDLVQAIGTVWAKFIPIIGLGFVAGGAYWLIYGVITGWLGKRRLRASEEWRNERDNNEKILDLMKYLLQIVSVSRWDSQISEWAFSSSLDRERARRTLNKFRQMELAPSNLSTARHWEVYLTIVIPIIEVHDYKEVIRLIAAEELSFPFD